LIINIFFQEELDANEIPIKLEEKEENPLEVEEPEILEDPAKPETPVTKGTEISDPANPINPVLSDDEEDEGIGNGETQSEKDGDTPADLKIDIHNQVIYNVKCTLLKRSSKRNDVVAN